MVRCLERRICELQDGPSAFPTRGCSANVSPYRRIPVTVADLLAVRATLTAWRGGCQAH